MKHRWLVAAALFVSCTGATSFAQTPDRSTMMTAIIDDVEPALRAAATCKMSSPTVFSEKGRKKIGDALSAAGLKPEQMAALLARLDKVEPFLADDRPVAEALVFCHSVSQDENFGSRKVFSLFDRLSQAQNLPPGRDDRQVLAVMKDIAVAQNNTAACTVMDSGPLPKRSGIRPDSEFGKELARFDISSPVRDYINNLYSRSVDFSAFKDIAALRAHCRAQSEAWAKAYKETRKLPPPPISKLKALQPVQ